MIAGRPTMSSACETVLEIVDRAGAGALQADLLHRHAEQLAVFRLFDRIGAGADHLDAEFREGPVLLQRKRRVKSRLPAHCRQQRVRLFRLDDAGHRRRRDRLDIGCVGHAGVGHDRRRVGVHQDDPKALGLQRLAGLCPRIVEFTGLSDDDRAGADDENGIDVVAARHVYPFRSSISAVKRSNR